MANMGEELAALWLVLFDEAVRGQKRGYYPARARAATAAELAVFGENAASLGAKKSRGLSPSELPEDAD